VDGNLSVVMVALRMVVFSLEIGDNLHIHSAKLRCRFQRPLHNIWFYLDDGLCQRQLASSRETRATTTGGGRH
jgi:hypothetical protein